jgi:hypothetical protein
MGNIASKPVLVDQLKPELGAKVVEAIARDNERARKARDKKRKRAKKKAEG